MAKSNNGASKVSRIITLIILISGILITFGATYATLNMRINTVETRTMQVSNISRKNEMEIVAIRSDLKYIIKGIDELRGK